MLKVPGLSGATTETRARYPSKSNTVSSYDDELRLLTHSDENLIELASRPASPFVQTSTTQYLNAQSSEQGQIWELPAHTRRVNVQPSLLDLHESYPEAISENWKQSTLMAGRDVDALSDPGHSLGNDSSREATCDQCERQTKLDYCNVCSVNLCRLCWDAQVSHRKQRLAPGSIPHEQTDYAIARKIRLALDSTRTEEQRCNLHQEDKNTTWFGIVRDDDAKFPIFQDYGRFAQIMADRTEPSSSIHHDTGEPRYPSLVSFVGDTGHGKSTIIRLLMDLSINDDRQFSSPVIGSAGEDLPTSADVHLYCEPSTSDSETPILFVDCEGLQGGERIPLGARFEQKGKSSGPSRKACFEMRDPNIQCTSEREITWADTTKRSRQFAVTHLYPRLLYTFSDVVVFVLKNPRVIESVFEKLLDWGAAALEKLSLFEDKVMAHFYKHASRGGQKVLISHSTCYSCLSEPPEHALPCGHILCTPCIKAYGVPRGKTAVDINHCPLEMSMSPDRNSWRIMLKPSAAGIRILTLDGGGMRGIVELEALRQIEHALGRRLPIQSFFDIIVGTSTGGIIALGLGAKDWSVEECTRHFQELTTKAFTKRFGSGIRAVSWFVENYNHSKYQTEPLEKALKAAFSEDEYLFGGRKVSKSRRFDIKVAVTATSERGSPVVLANYNRLCAEKLLYHFQRPENLKAELHLWEVARATSAAPRYFTPFRHQPSKQVLLDGAIYHNNPIQIADAERKLLWPALRNELPDMILSIGTAHRSTENVDENPQSPKISSGIISHGRSLFKIAFDHMASTLDSERTWQTYLGILQPPPSHQRRYMRLNPELCMETPRLDEVDKLDEVQGRSRFHLARSPLIQEIANQLIASSFYFEKLKFTESENGAVKCSGHIYCRFPADSPEISELGRFLQTRIQPGQGVRFISREEHQIERWEDIPIEPTVVEKMIKQKQFQMPKIHITLSSKLVTTDISLFLGTDELYPISRFPRPLLQDEEAAQGVRKAATPNPRRWASRTQSQTMRRNPWVPPDLSKAPQRAAILSHYSDKEYVIGNSTWGGLQKIADRLAGQQADLTAFFSARSNELSELDGTSSMPATTGGSFTVPWAAELPAPAVAPSELESPAISSVLGSAPTSSFTVSSLAP